METGQMQKALQQKLLTIDPDVAKFLVNSCAEVERTAKTLMRDTMVNTSVSYGRKGHHPSVEGYAPAPDSGTLLQSITHSIEVQNGIAKGYVGSILKNPEYPKFLEYGTSKMKPRPWLSASLIKCQKYISGLFREIFGK